MSSDQYIYDYCVVDAISSEQEDVVRCLAEKLEKVAQENKYLFFGLDVFFLIFAATLLFLMQAGFAMVCAGCVRRKNVQNTMLKNLLDACSAALGFWSFGYALAYGGDDRDGPITFAGRENFFLVGLERYERWIFQFAFAATSTTIVAGTVAERCQMATYLGYATLMTGFVYPIVAHAMWSENGILSSKRSEPLFGTGVLDVAGAGVVHVTGGLTALIATSILGSRKDRFHDSEGTILERSKIVKIKGHSPVLQVLGTLLLWFGWFGFNAGSVGSVSTPDKARAAALAIANTALGASTGCISALLISTLKTERLSGELVYDISIALNGSLSGLVSITAGCSVIEPWVAVIVGFVAGIIYLVTSKMLDRFLIDDAVDAIPVHLFNGLWGVVATGLLASPKHLKRFNPSAEHAGFFFTGDPSLLGVNLLGLLFICSWVSVTMTPFFVFMGYAGYFRSDPLEEVVGLDISYHGVANRPPVESGFDIVVAARESKREEDDETGSRS